MKIKQKRFAYYEPFGDLGDVEAVGLIAAEKDFDYGTPNLERPENLLFVASNADLNECLEVRIKWRPIAGKQLVTMVSQMTLVVENETLEFSQVETYKPTESHLKEGRYTQYGSGSSKLKLLVPQPYRRTRLVFNGHMRRRTDQSAVFVKLSCLAHPVTQLFDFLEQYDDACLRQVHAIKSPVRTVNQVISNLLLHDRHEQKVRLIGELTVFDHKSQSRHQKAVALYGFYARHFAQPSGENMDDERNISTRRLLAYMNNGQAFHLATRKFDLDEVDFGYTSFEIFPKIEPINKPFKLDWSQLEAGDKFSLEVSGQKQTFESSGQRKSGNWFQITTNGKPGWAWFSQADGMVDSPQELEAISRSREERERAIQAGEMLAPPLESDSTSNVAEAEASAPLVVGVDEDSCSNSQLVGSKAASLAQLVRFTQAKQATTTSYLVPFALVLTKHAHDLVVEENRELSEAIDELQQFVGSWDQLKPECLREKCKRLVDVAAEQSKFPDLIREQLWARLTKHYGTDKAGQLTFAVRSSSWGEDEDDMSAAGQLSTILNVKFDSNELARAVMACFASKFNYENIEYKRQHGLPLNLPMAVVVQGMISCQKAGVMFTCDPTTGDESLITITANYGLGESVVSAQADPDSITVRTNPFAVGTPQPASGEQTKNEQESLEIDKIAVGRKDVIIEGSGGKQSQDVDRTKCCLSNEEILRLAKCGLEIKRFFWSQRRDIEWGYLDGLLYLFQSRPVTGLESFTNEELLHELDRPGQAEVGFFTRANIGEVMPYAIKPLTLTYSVFVWNSIGARLFSKYDPEVVYVPQCSTEVFFEKYHMFFNLRCSMMLPMSDAERPVLAKSMEIGFFGREMGPQPDIIEASKGFVRPPNPLQKKRFWSHLPLKWMPFRTILREKYVFDRLRTEMRSLKERREPLKGTNRMLELYDQMRFLLRHVYNCWENHICVIMYASNNNMVLSAVLSKYIRDPVQLSAATNKFLAISPDVISAEIPARVEKMAKLIKAHGPDELQKFISMDDAEALEYLRSGSTSKELRQDFDKFLEMFGHRCYNEFELAEFAWRERPEMVVHMIRQNCLALAKAGSEPTEDQRATEPNSTKANGIDQHAEPETRAPQPAAPRPKTIDEVIESLGVEIAYKERMLIKYLLAPRCQKTLAMREQTKNMLVLYTDVLREASRMMAKEMQRQLRIPDKDLFYYLTLDELKPLIRAHQPAIVCQAAKRRQMFKRTFNELWKFDEIIRDMTPNHLKPTKELSEAIAEAPKLFGTPASSGRVQGKVCLIQGYNDIDRVQAGTILLTHSTDIAFSPVFPLISGIITEVGGLISHGAVVAREYGLPSVIGIPDVTRILQDGEEIILDADNGAIIRLSKKAVEASN